MILYNSLIGVLAGAALIVLAMLLRNMVGSTVPTAARLGYGVAFLAVATPLAVLSTAMTLTWPLENNPPLNKLFAEPALLLAALLLAAGVVLVCARGEIDLAEYRPAAVPVMALGAIAVVGATSFFSYEVVRTAPPAEPIMGRVGETAPLLDGILWGVGYLLAGAAALAAPLWHRPAVRRVVVWVLVAVGVWLLLRSAVGGYRGQVGLLINFERELTHRW